MRIYETTFIVNPQTDNATIDQNVRAVSDLITGNGGKVIKESHMGTRRLAYPIQGLTQGYYATFYFEAEPKVLPVLERHFKLEEQYVRHLLIKFDGDPKWLEPDDKPESRPTIAEHPRHGGRRPEGPPRGRDRHDSRSDHGRSRSDASRGGDRPAPEPAIKPTVPKTEEAPPAPAEDTKPVESAPAEPAADDRKREEAVSDTKAAEDTASDDKAGDDKAGDDKLTSGEEL